MHEGIRAFFCLFLSQIGNSEKDGKNVVYHCKDFTNESSALCA